MTEDYIPTAEEQIERRVDSVIRELDELCALAINPETVDLIEGQKHSIGMAMIRCQLIMSFLLERSPTKLRIVRNG